MPRSPGHAFYDRLQDLLREGGFDDFVEGVCKPYYAARMGAPSLPPGRYFRMHMIGYFEGIDSERGIAWRCADLFSLRDFLRLSNRDKVPDHSWLSRTRSRLPHEAHEKVFGFVLKLVAERGLVKGERIGVDGSTMEANAALRTIVRRDNGESYREMLTRMAKESGIDTPSAEDLARFDRKRKGKTLSNADWKSPTDPEAKIARMKDGTTFNEVSQEWLVRVVQHRIGDPRIVRLIQKWLKAGVLEDGEQVVSERGTGQGSVISPLLANVYLHYVFDLWADRWRRRKATGNMVMVRYADDSAPRRREEEALM